ncbi:MAG TPA: hypothetical protein VHE35_37500 [Kofleriaceae bacterium]|nr:hypothetical protein [Kofleriaceae bacterium]
MSRFGLSTDPGLLACCAGSAASSRGCPCPRCARVAARRGWPGTASRLALLALAALALTASAAKKTPPLNQYNAQNAGQPGLPAPQAMDPRAPLGLWNTNFGAVKIEPNGTGLHGAWSYDRDNQQVVGYFAGALDGNLLRLTWREPAQATPGVPQLSGEGWIAFDPQGSSFAGKWWSTDGQRKGDWTGTRVVQPIPDAASPSSPSSSYGGSSYGGDTYAAPSYPPPSYPPPSYPPPAGTYSPPPTATYPPPGR